VNFRTEKGQPCEAVGQQRSRHAVSTLLDGAHKREAI
jgi:hypothetical protein